MWWRFACFWPRKSGEGPPKRADPDGLRLHRRSGRGYDWFRRKLDASLLSYSDRGRVRQAMILGFVFGGVIGLFTGYLAKPIDAMVWACRPWLCWLAITFPPFRNCSRISQRGSSGQANGRP